MRASTRRDTQKYAQTISQSYFNAPKIFWSFVTNIVPELVNFLCLPLIFMVM